LYQYQTPERIEAMVKELLHRVTWRHLAYVGIVVLSVLLLAVGNRIASRDMYRFQEVDPAEVATARVDRILTRDVQRYQMGDDVLEDVTVYFEATITGGPRKGAELAAVQLIRAFDPVPMREVSEGERIAIIHSQDQGTSQYRWEMQEYLRTTPLILLVALFLGLVMLFGKGKGVSTVLSLCFTCAAVFAVLIPAILSGRNIYLATLAVCAYVVIMTLALVNGLNRKSFAAAMGCMGGLLAAGGLTLIMDSMLRLTGYLDENSAFLLNLGIFTTADLRALIFAGILIGAMGAALDVAVSMAASLAELKATAPELGFAALVRSGFNIGRDILGTMTNTLILAYIGSCLPLLLLLLVHMNSVTELLNREMMVVEILQAVVGSIGMLCVIPLTAVIAGYIYTVKGKEKAPAKPDAGTL